MLPLLLACATPPTSLRVAEVAAAELQGANFDNGSLIGGIVLGDALLVVEDVAGLVVTEPVAFRGTAISLGAETTVDPELGGPIPLELPDAPVSGEQLLGTYRGTAESLVVGVGVSARQLKNQHDVRLRELHLAVGVGTMVGVQWIRVVPGGSEGDELLDPIDSGLFAADDTGLPASGSCASRSGGPARGFWLAALLALLRRRAVRDPR